ncbi:MAG: Card1-like endonuclease domain-containing protein, partial [Methylococcales bacterium]
QRLSKTVFSIQDIGRGLEPVRSRGKSDAANELDVVFLAENRLYVIECKTGNFNESEKGDSALYKLNTLSGQ